LIDELVGRKLDREQCNRLILLVKRQRESANWNATIGWRRGDRVKFRSERHIRVIRGTVDRIGQKYIYVDSGEGNWRVPASWIEKDDHGS
jgi:hypothetical protein